MFGLITTGSKGQNMLAKKTIFLSNADEVLQELGELVELDRLLYTLQHYAKRYVEG